MKKYIVAIDLGGMSAKGALFTLDGEILCEEKVKTNKADGFEGTLKKLSDLACALVKKQGVSMDEAQRLAIARAFTARFALLKTSSKRKERSVARSTL